MLIFNHVVDLLSRTERGNIIPNVLSSHVETVVLMSRGKE